MPLWLGLLFGLCGIASLGFALTYNLILNRPTTRLEMTRSSYIAFGGQATTTPSQHTVRVQILFDNSAVEGLQQLVLLFRNTGNRVVTHSKDEQLYVEFPDKVSLLTAELGGTPEGDLSFHVSTAAEEHRVYVDFATLKPREEFSCSVFFLGDLGPDTPRLKGRSLAQLVTTARLGPETAQQRVPWWLALLSIAGTTFCASLLSGIYLLVQSSRRKVEKATEVALASASQLAQQVAEAHAEPIIKKREAEGKHE